MTPKAILILALLSTGGCSVKTPDSTVLGEAKLTPSRFADVARIEHSVRLENKGLTLASIRKVVQGNTGDLFASDMNWSNRVFQFMGSGQFVRSFGLDAVPSRRNVALIDFDIAGDSVTMLTQHALIRLSLTSGQPLASTSLDEATPALPLHLARTTDLWCVLSTADIRCFDDSLTLKHRYQIYEDKLFSRYIHGPFEAMVSLSSGQFAASEYYSPSLVIYGPSSPPRRYVVATARADEAKFAQLWAQAPERGPDSEAWEARVRNEAHRFSWIRPVPGGLAILDSRRKPAIEDVLLVDTSNWNATRFAAGVGRLKSTLGQDLMIFDLAVGSSSKGLIGAVPNDDVVSALADYWPNSESCRGAWQCLFFLEFVR